MQRINKWYFLTICLLFGSVFINATNTVSAESLPLPISSVTASTDDGNIPENTIDNNLTTRWSAEGDGEWIEYDLGVIDNVSQALIAFYLGDQRSSQFDIQTSTDRSSWLTVFSGNSSGTTLQQQQFDIQESLARYVRIIGYGNSINAWNSITEVDIMPLNVTGVMPPPQNFLQASTTEPPDIPVGTTDSLSQNGITWTFDKPVEYGQFVNGDYWVIPDGDGDVDITAITPGPTTISGLDANGSMINPVPANAQGYTGLGSAYNSSLNAALNLPLALVAGNNIISTTSQEVQHIKTVAASILTVVSSAPPANSFRPGYCDTARTLYNESDLDYSLLEKLTPTASSPTPSAIEDQFARVWLDHAETTVGRHMHPINNMENYGRDLAEDLGEAALVLHMDYTDVEKKNLLVGFIQIGIDLYSIYKSGEYALTIWHNDGGHSHGRKWPILFAGLMLNDSDMMAIGAKSGDYKYNGTYNDDGTFTPPADYFQFGEDDTTYYVNQEMVDLTNGPNWNPETPPGEPYSSGLIGMPEWSIKQASKPYASSAHWGASYRRCCTSRGFAGPILAAHIMNAKSLWNHNAIFDYTDRYESIEKGDGDPFGYIVPGETTGGRTNTFVSEMWDTYRKNY